MQQGLLRKKEERYGILGAKKCTREGVIVVVVMLMMMRRESGPCRERE